MIIISNRTLVAVTQVSLMYGISEKENKLEIENHCSQIYQETHFIALHEWKN